MIYARLFYAFLFVVPVTLQAQLRLPALFGDNMVLQRNTQAPVWGWAYPGTDVSIRASWNNEEVKARASSMGIWSAALSTPDAGGPYTVTITSGSEITLQNVM